MGQHMHPDVMLECAAMAHAMPAWEAGDYPAARAILAQSIERLAAGGCDFFACPTTPRTSRLKSGMGRSLRFLVSTLLTLSLNARPTKA